LQLARPLLSLTGVPSKSLVALINVVIITATLGCSARSHSLGDAPSGEGGGALPNVGAVPFAVSGARLKAWFLVSGASQAFDTFHDQQLDTDCSFEQAGGSSHVCFPSATADVVYLDASCHEPAWTFDVSSDFTPPVWVSGMRGAPASERVGYRVTELVFAGGLGRGQAMLPPLFAASQGGCQPTQPAGLLLPSVYRLEPQDETTFVAASVVPLPVSDELSLQRLRADDGAELTLGVLGPDGKACEPQVDGVCVPVAFSVLRAEPGPGLFVDAGCARPAFDPAAEGFVSAPKLGIDRTTGVTRVFELEATAAFVKLPQLDPATGEPLLAADGQPTFSCQADARFAAWAPGAERTARLAVAAQLRATFGELRWVQQRAPGLDAEQSSPLERGGVFLDQQGVGCRVGAPYGHQLQCVVDSPEVYQIGLASDPACSQRLYDVVGGSDNAATRASISRLRRVDGLGSDALTLLSFKAYSGPTFRGASGACEPAGPTTSLLQVDSMTPLPTFTRAER
jgi:hypothetical protein